MADRFVKQSDKQCIVRIESSQLELSARSSLARQQLQFRQISPPPAQPPAPLDQVSLSGETAPADAKLLLMLQVAEMMLGRKIRLFHLPATGAPVQVPEPGGSAPPVQVRGVDVQVEAEQARFRARGSVTTADGRRIEFHADLTLARQFVSVSAGEGAPGGAKDPLILNFDGQGVRLLQDRLRFDLNGDGQPESVPLAAPGNGILFADRNGDGVANNGTELFGPSSGNGFGELARQDADGNGWIDQGDPLFGQLRVWFADAAGPGAVYSLADLGIGALSTASAATPFDLRAAGNGLLGQIRGSGVYLREDGQAGFLQQVDLAV